MKVVLRLSSNMISNSDDETDFPHKLLLTNRQVSNLGKVFANKSSTYIKSSKTQLPNMIHLIIKEDFSINFLVHY